MKLILSPAMLKHLIEKAGLSQRGFSVLVRTSPATINNLATGRRLLCNDDLAESIERELMVPACSLFADAAVSRRTVVTARRDAA